MDREKFKGLKNQIWITRISRVKAEKRLIDKENFVQGINIYYSCMAIIFSICSLLENDNKLSLMTVFMTISLMIVVLYLNGQRYIERSREYRKNYVAMQNLEFRLEHLNENDTEEIQTIEKEYCELLESSENHISYDYHYTICIASEFYCSFLE